MKNMLTVSTFAILALLAAPVHAAPDQSDMDPSAKIAGEAMDHGDHCGMPTGEGVINAFDVRKSKVDLTHEPIESIGWPEMRMQFSVLKPVDLSAFAVGERVHFMLKAEKDKSYSIAMMCSLDADEGTHEACMTKMHDVAMKSAADVGVACPMGEMDGMKGMDHGDMGKSGDAAKTDHKGHH